SSSFLNAPLSSAPSPLSLHDALPIFFIAHPLIWILQSASELILRALGLEVPGAEREPLSEAELRMLLGRATEHGEIEQEEQEMLDRKSTRLNSSHRTISYAVFCLKKK